MKFLSRYKKIAIPVGTLVLSYFFEKILDSLGVYEKVSTYVINNDITWLKQAIEKQYTLWKILIFAIVLIICYVVMRLLTINYKEKKKISIQETAAKKQEDVVKHFEKLKKNFKKDYANVRIDENLGVKTHFDINGDRIHSLRLELLCLRHGTPYKMLKDSIMGYVCPDGSCRTTVKDSFIENQFDRLYNIVESELQNKWETAYQQFENSNE